METNYELLNFQKEVKYPKTLKSQKIIHFRTLKSWYDNDCLGVVDDKERYYRIKCDHLLASLGYINPVFNVVKARVHYYLEINFELSQIELDKEKYC